MEKAITIGVLIELIILGIVKLIIKLFKPQILGKSGEHGAKEMLNELPKDEYRVLNDIMIFSNGETHQIDHVVVSIYGVFVIETKQYNGYITGGKYDKHWIRHVGRNEIYYTNPIRQNMGHVKTICQLLNLDETKVFNIVFIPSTAKLKIDHDGELVRYDELKDKILSYQNIIITNVDDIVNTIELNNITDREERKAHNENVREKINEVDENNCPKCGGELVERKGKFGRFLGCSNYPNCRYTRKR